MLGAGGRQSKAARALSPFSIQHKVGHVTSLGKRGFFWQTWPSLLLGPPAGPVVHPHPYPACPRDLRPSHIPQVQG